MKKYTNHKKSFVRTIFENYKFLRQQIKNLQQTKASLEKQMSREVISGNMQEAYLIKEECDKINKKLERLEYKYLQFKKSFAKVAATLGLTAALLGSTIAGYSTIKQNNDFNNILEESFSIVQENDFYNSTGNYQTFKDNLSRYIELSNKTMLSSAERAEKKYLKDQIRNSPEEITSLSLEILKTKIADSLGIEDYSRITIHNNSTQIRADENHLQSGYLEKIDICIDGKTIYSRNAFTPLSTNETRVSSDTIPQEVLDVIYEISKAQGQDTDFNEARSALKSSLDLNVNEISFEPIQENDYYAR